MDSEAGFSFLNVRAKELLLAASLLLLVDAAVALRVAFAQDAAAAGVVEGRITCNDSGAPARGAHVALVPLPGKKKSGLPNFNETADFDGYYSFAGVPAGEYLVQVGAPGYTDDVLLALDVWGRFSEDQQKELLGNLPRVTVKNGRALENVVIRRGGAISGHVRFSDGGAPIRASVRVTMVSGSLLGPADAGQQPDPLEIGFIRATTDDRGVYRLAGLPKGKYRVTMQMPQLVMFAPDAFAKPEAKEIAVDEGDEVSDVDITIPAQLHSISGTVTRGGGPIGSATLFLSRKGEDGNRNGEIRPDGSYRFEMLRPGTYTILVVYPEYGAEDRAPRIEKEITVVVGEGDVTDANVDLPVRVPRE
jgi:hypothetical protein